MSKDILIYFAPDGMSLQPLRFVRYFTLQDNRKTFVLHKETSGKVLTYSQPPVYNVNRTKPPFLLLLGFSLKARCSKVATI
jgi:hypothetical protein